MTKSPTHKLNKCRNKLTSIIEERDDLQERLTYLNKSIFNYSQDLERQTTGSKRKSKRSKRKISKRKRSKSKRRSNRSK